MFSVSYRKKLTHLSVSALLLTHNPISECSSSLSDISKRFFFSSQLSLFIADLFRIPPQPDLSPVFPHNLLRRKPQ